MNEKKFALITAIGADRPGIVEQIAAWILEQGGNIEESRMAQLGGAFAAIILASGDAGFQERIETARKAFQDKNNLTVFTQPVSEQTPAPAEPALRYTLQASSLDTPGIVHEVSRTLRHFGINIVSADTRTESTPFTGSPAFYLDMEIDVPASVPIRKLREALAELGDRLNMDIALNTF